MTDEFAWVKTDPWFDEWSCERSDHGLLVYPYGPDGSAPGGWNACAEVSVEGPDVIRCCRSKDEAMQACQDWSLNRERESGVVS